MYHPSRPIILYGLQCRSSTFALCLFSFRLYARFLPTSLSSEANLLSALCFYYWYRLDCLPLPYQLG